DPMLPKIGSWEMRPQREQLSCLLPGLLPGLLAQNERPSLVWPACFTGHKRSSLSGRGRSGHRADRCLAIASARWLAQGLSLEQIAPRVSWISQRPIHQLQIADARPVSCRAFWHEARARVVAPEDQSGRLKACHAWLHWVGENLQPRRKPKLIHL